MRTIEIKRKKDQLMICSKSMIAESLLERLIGLMFKKNIESGSGLLIVPCYQIHTFFMFMSIDVVFIDKKFNVLKVYRNLRPWRLSRIVWKSKFVLEMMAGDLPTELEVGDQLEELCLS